VRYTAELIVLPSMNVKQGLTSKTALAYVARQLWRMCIASSEAEAAVLTVSRYTPSAWLSNAGCARKCTLLVRIHSAIAAQPRNGRRDLEQRRQHVHI
jgi:hypothetical protein